MNHALLALGAMHAGIAVAPISPAYSLLSTDHAKLKAIFELLQPDWCSPTMPRDSNQRWPRSARRRRRSRHCSKGSGAGIDEAFAAIGPDTVAKILFTSGSTGAPKGVINTQRMLCSNQQASRRPGRFSKMRRPSCVEWLPWNHTFGGNATFNIVLRNGGTLYIDGGKPTWI